MLSRVVAVVLTLVLAAGCGEPVNTDIRVTWADVQKPGFLDEYVSAAYLASVIYVPSSKAQGRVVLIRADGTSNVLPTGGQDNGEVAASPKRELTFTSPTVSYLAAGERSDRWRRGGRQDTGHWSGFTASGWGVNVFATGATVDVFAMNGADRTHSVINDAQGATGVSGDSVWLMNGGSGTTEGTVRLYRADARRDNSTELVMSWRYTDADKGSEFAEESDLWSYDDALWYLEEIQTVTKNGSYPRRPRSVQVRLARLDPQRKTYDSHLLSYRRNSLAEDGRRPSAIGYAASGGYLRDGALYTIDGKGNLLKVDLRTHVMSTVATLSQQARDADQAVAAFRDDRLQLLLVDEDDWSVDLETYDLRSGKQLTSVPVPAVAKELESDREVFPWSLAALR